MALVRGRIVDRYIPNIYVVCCIVCCMSYVVSYGMSYVVCRMLYRRLHPENARATRKPTDSRAKSERFHGASSSRPVYVGGVPFSRAVSSQVHGMYSIPGDTTLQRQGRAPVIAPPRAAGLAETCWGARIQGRLAFISSAYSTSLRCRCAFKLLKLQNRDQIVQADGAGGPHPVVRAFSWQT
jgi:hypothetical protein